MAMVTKIMRIIMVMIAIDGYHSFLIIMIATMMCSSLLLYFSSLSAILLLCIFLFDYISFSSKRPQ